MELTFLLRFLPHIRSTSSSVAPSDSVSQIADSSNPSSTHTPYAPLQPCPTQSTICPGGFDPSKICWTKRDFTHNPENKVPDANKSRARMQEAIRHPHTFQPLSDDQWAGLRSVAIECAQVLTELPNPKTPKKARGYRTVDWYQANYPKQFNGVVTAIKAREPILTYCGNDWKTIGVLSIVLRSMKPRGGSGGAAEPASDSSDSDTMSTASEEDVAPARTDKPSKKRPREDSGAARKKSKDNQPANSEPALEDQQNGEYHG
jgi:hypothetical protein